MPSDSKVIEDNILTDAASGLTRAGAAMGQKGNPHSLNAPRELEEERIVPITYKYITKKQMSSSLKNKTVKGLSWSFIDNIASQGISFIVGIVLARLLSPDEFGTIGVAMIFVALFNKIVDCGFSNALIRKQDADGLDYNTTFIFNLGLSVALYIICIVIAPYVSVFFHNDALTGVVRWISLVLIINAFAIIHRTYLVKKVDFKTQAKISVVSSVISGICGITMALRGMGVWSLVGQQLSRQFCYTFLLWIVNKWRPKLEFSILRFKSLFSYGGKLMLSGIIDTLFNEITTIVVGKLYTPYTLGQYSRAKQFSTIFSSNLSTVMERVTYPVLSGFQNNNEQLLAYYKRIIRALMLITGLGTVIIASCSKSIILILLGPQWTDAIVYLQLLAFVEITIPLKNVNLNLLQVYGRSDYILYLSIIKRFIELGAVCLGFISLNWMLIGYAVAGVIGFLLNAFYTERISGYTVISQLKDIMPSLSLVMVVGLVMYLVSLFIGNIWIALFAELIIGGFSFFVIAELFLMKDYLFLKETIVGYFKHK